MGSSWVSEEAPLGRSKCFTTSLPHENTHTPVASLDPGNVLPIQVVCEVTRKREYRPFALELPT